MPIVCLTYPVSSIKGEYSSYFYYGYPDYVSFPNIFPREFELLGLLILPSDELLSFVSTLFENCL